MGLQLEPSSESFHLLATYHIGKSPILSQYPLSSWEWGQNPLLEGPMVGDTTHDLAFPRIFHIASFKEAKVAEVISQGSNGVDWNLPFIRDLHKCEISFVGNLMDSLWLVFLDRNERDSRVWIPSPNGVFSALSFFSILLESNRDSLSIPLDCIWKSVAPPRVKVFSWIAFLGK